MLVVKTWCLPADLTEQQLNDLHNAIVKAVVSIREVGVKDESHMLNLFPRDMMSYGLGSEIIIEISRVPADCSISTLNRLSKSVTLAVRKELPKARIFECEISRTNKDIGLYRVIGIGEQFEQECAEGLHS